MWLVLAAALLAACGGSGNSPADRIPDQFEFANVDNAFPGDFYEGSVTISGLDDGEVVPAWLTGITNTLELLINGKKQEHHQNREVRNGDVVTIRLQAMGEPGAEAKATLYAGDPPVFSVFRVTTRATDDPPEIVVDFPPPISLTDASAITVRGRVRDDWSEIASVKVNGSEVPVNPDGTWYAQRSLVEGGQDIVIQASDQAGVATATRSVTYHASIDDVSFGSGAVLGSTAGGLALIPGASRLLYGFSQLIAEIDLATGERDLRSFAGAFDGSLSDIVLDAGRLQVYAASYPGPHEGLVLFDLETGTVEVVSYKGDGKGDDTLFGYVASVAFDPVNEVSYLLVRDAADPMAGIWRIWRVDRDGNREPVAEAPYSPNARLRHDARNNRLLLAANDLYAIDPATGKGEVLAALEEGNWFLQLAADPESGEIAAYLRKTGDVYEIQLLRPGGQRVVLPGGGDPIFGPRLGHSYGYDVDWQHRVAYVGSAGPNHGTRITAIDLETGHRVIVAKE